MKRYLIIIAILSIFSYIFASDWNQYYFSFKINDRSELTSLTKIISIDNVKGNTVYAYANDIEWNNFRKLSYEPQLLPNPGDLIQAVMSSTPEQLRDWTSYPTYSAYESMMYGFATSYPNLCQIVDIGTTPGGRKLLFAKISDNISTHEAEPEIMLTSSMHGDETTGYVLMLRLIDTLLSQYGTDTRITNLVNGLEIWINPLANPDGTYYGGNSSVTGSRRYNLAGYDLNRNYPDADGTQHPDGYAWGFETSAMMNIANSHHFVLSCNFHGGAEVVNYPWDTFSYLHVDDAWFQTISRAYATSAQNNSPAGYLDDLNNGITNGYAWYTVDGSRQDWMTYYKGCREVTIELSTTKTLPAAQLNAYWTYNYDAFLGYLENAYYGIKGVVTDGYGNPLDATITILSHDDAHSVVKTDPTCGDYYRMIAPGTYSVQVSSTGFPTQTFNNITVTQNNATILNVTMGDVISTQTFNLQAGWNLISLNVVPANLSLTTVFSSVMAQLIQIKDDTHSHNPSVASVYNNLSSLVVGKGYWVKMSSNATLSVSGTPANPAEIQISLTPGWNLVGYPKAAASNISSALSGIISNVQEVRYLNETWTPDSKSGSLSQMQPGKGYWIKVSQPCNLIFSN